MKRRIVQLIIVAASVATVLLAAELALRAAGYASLAWYRADPVLGWTLRPGLSGWFTEEGRAFVRVNSAGQRDRPRAVDKPQDVYRIAVLGDAFSEGMQVPLDRTYWALLPERLASCGFQPGKRIEVLNFGVRGYGTAQSYLMLQTVAIRYQPDLVLLQFTNGNDVRDNSFALDPGKDRPFFMLDEQGSLLFNDSFRSAAAYARRASISREVLRSVADRSRLLQLARGARELKVLGQAHAGATGNVAGLEIHTLAAPRDVLWQDAWRVTEGLIERIGEFAARNGAKLAVVTVPFAMQAHPDAGQREALLARFGVPDLAYPERRIASFAERAGHLGIMLGPQMQALAVSSGAYLYGFDNTELGFGHWNELGHRAAAELIAPRLCASGF
jgi:hypothetical protein